MPLLAALWLALVALLAAPTALGESVALRAAPAHREEALRAPRLVAAPGLVRVEAPRASAPRSHAPPAPGLAPAAAGPSASVATVAASRAARQPSHAPAARGGHLPYFPTAPPLQG